MALEVRDKELILTVEDNGSGFTNDAPANGGGRGLHNMRERARAIGATINWRTSRFSTGTCFELRLPLSPSTTETES